MRAVELEEMTGTWSAVIFWHSLEHLRRPVRSLRHAAKLVAPGGVLVVAVPNATSMQARLFGDYWLALDLPRHLVHISPPALLSQVEELGFKVERVSYMRGGQVLFGWLHGLVRGLPGHPDLYDAIRRTEAQQATQRPSVRLYALAAGSGRASGRPGRVRHRGRRPLRRHDLRRSPAHRRRRAVRVSALPLWPAGVRYSGSIWDQRGQGPYDDGSAIGPPRRRHSRRRRDPRPNDRDGTVGGRVLGRGRAEYPVPGAIGRRAESDPGDWWRATARAVRQAVAQARDAQIVGLAVAGQMHGLVLAPRPRPPRPRRGGGGGRRRRRYPAGDPLARPAGRRSRPTAIRSCLRR